MVLQCTATILKEQIKLCLSCEGFGNRLCFLETTSNAQVCFSFMPFWIYEILSKVLDSQFPVHFFFAILECSSWSGYMLLYPGAVLICAGPSGDAANTLSLMRSVQSTYIRSYSPKKSYFKFETAWGFSIKVNIFITWKRFHIVFLSSGWISLVLLLFFSFACFRQSIWING